MLTHKQLFDLLNRPETPYVDFKGGEYDLYSPRGVKGKGYLDLIKDILYALCEIDLPEMG